jgi:hypothetical protein
VSAEPPLALIGVLQQQAAAVASWHVAENVKCLFTAYSFLISANFHVTDIGAKTWKETPC